MKAERKVLHKRFERVEELLDEKMMLDEEMSNGIRKHIVMLARKATRDNQNFISFIFFKVGPRRLCTVRV